MEPLQAIGLFLVNAVWRLTGWRAAGRRLIRALASPIEDARTLAGMFLVRAGERAAPLLQEAMHRNESLPLVLTVAGDLGDPRFEPELRRFSQSPDPEVAKAAREALRLLPRGEQPAG
jgi:hypothetical protein